MAVGMITHDAFATQPLISRGARPRERARLVVSDDHPVVLLGLERLLRHEPDFLVVACCRTAAETVVAVRRHRPDVLILDIHVARKNEFAVLRELRRDGLQATDVVVIGDELREDEFLEVTRLGVRGTLLQGLALRMLVQCVRKVLAGDTWVEQRALGRAIDALLLREPGAHAMGRSARCRPRIP